MAINLIHAVIFREELWLFVHKYQNSAYILNSGYIEKLTIQSTTVM